MWPVFSVFVFCRPRACVSACMRACVCQCVRACVRVSVRACVFNNSTY